jgi:acyl dehydratase
MGLERMLRLGSYWDISWSERVNCGDELTSTSTLIEPELINRHRGGFVIKQNAETVYKNQKGVEVARAVCGTMRIPKRGTGGAGYSLREHSYTPEDIAKIEANILAEVVRGDEPRYADEVTVGDTLQPIVKGPLTDMDSACWFAGYNIVSLGGPPLEIRVRSRAAEYMNIWADQWDGHVDPNFASEMGMPGAWMSGPAVYSWMCQLLTNWCGDDGFVERLTAAIRKPSVVGDTIWYRGTVTRVEGRRVFFDLRGDNQVGERVITGQASVLLPQR